MKLSLGNKLTVLLCLFGLLLSGLASYYSLSSSKQILVAAAKRDLLVANQVLGRNLQISLENFANDLKVLSTQSQPVDVLEDTPRSNREAVELTQLFTSMLNAHPEYQRIRLIEAKNHGLERINVDPQGPVSGNALHEKGHFPYVFKTLKLVPGQQFFSEIAPSRLDPDKALTLHLASPIWKNDQQVLGLIVLSIDVKKLFSRLQREIPDYYQLFLANSQGELLLNPERNTSQGRDQGPSVMIQSQLPELLALLEGQSTNMLSILPAKREQPTRLAAFTSVSIEAESNHLLLGLAVPEEHILQASRELDQRLVQIIVALSLITLLLSLWLARKMIRPLNQIGLAIAHFSKNLSLQPLPIERGDELGKLARDIRAMQEKILAQIIELNTNQQELQHMAHNDPLTGLPNRRLFFDRLQHAISNAKRNGKLLGLLYIDLDHFKEINDSHGHAAGDKVLGNVAHLLGSVTRSGDTVARLGGDEFVILFDEVENRATLLGIAQKLLALLQNRLLIDGKDLQVRASLGISLYPQDGSDAQTLLQNADRAMYSSKRSGRNTITCA
ncbi:GGDEF domain-containing protein [Pseudomonas anguilliseptica]|uniref:GGDEF domain-containing protein n=1 Tax=Pseudomonas anguilliseptica TaxID=53406 RepID=UPI0022AFC63D|nr:GGDEF domain-containing protein [Pseudomonas anguilliseptica]MCZ4324052.1 GGDEF domain-containing protein [Pseudomonas anguilliseptica]